MTLREIVEAGAGCGKTTGLVDRYVAALGLHKDPALKNRYCPPDKPLPHAREILALTFTNEAARQMQERILKRLNADGNTLEARSVREESQISTYHSFCLRLLQPYLVKRGFEGPLLSPVLAKTLRREYLIKALSEYPAASAVRRVLNLSKILSAGTQLWFHALDVSPVEEMKRTYAASEARFHAYRRAMIPEAETLALSIAARDKKPNPEAWAYTLLEALKNPCRESFAKVVFTKGPRWQKLENPELHEKAENLREFYKEGYGSFLDPATCDEEFHAQETLWNFLKWALIKKPKIFDLEAAEHELLSLLKETAPGRLIAAPRLILVDEFQDTNFVQFEILQHISDDDTQWYFVGDPKQSIYAFRGGDVSLFYKLRNELERKNLDTNYRSHTRILELVNRLQPEIFRHKENSHDPEPQTLKWPDGKNKGQLSFHWLEEKESTLSYTAKLLLKNRDHFEKSSTAVLFRTWKNLYAFAEILRSAGLNFRIAGSENPFEHILTDIFCSYLISQENPENLEGFWALERWQESAKFSWEKLLPTQQLTEKYKLTERSWSSTFQRFCEQIQVTRFDNATAWVTAMERWLKTRASEGLASRLTRTQLALWIQNHRSNLESENPYRLTPDDPSMPGLTLLTLHGSKGLEFRHVYLPELFEKVSNKKSGTFESEEGYILVSVDLKHEAGLKRRSLAFELRQTHERLEKYAEQKRMLYVALTRAIEGLHVVGHLAKDPSKNLEALQVIGVPKPVPAYWHHALQNLKLEDIADVMTIKAPEGTGSADEEEPPALWSYPRAIKVPQSPHTEFHRCGVSSYLKLTEEVAEAESDPSSKSQKHARTHFDFAAQNEIGTDFHALLELWNGGNTQLECLISNLKPDLKAPLKKAAQKLRTLPELAEYWGTLEHSPDLIQREFGLFLISDEYRLSGFADAVWYRSKDELVLIDWKSGASLRRLQSSERIEKFRRQLQLYARGFTGSFPKIRLEVYGIEIQDTPQAARLLSENFEVT